MPYGRMRSRRRMVARPIIQSVKNQAASKLSTVSNVDQTIIPIEGVDVGAATKVLGREVPTGSKVFGVNVSVNFISDTGGSTGNFDWYYAVVRSGQAIPPITSPDWTDIGLSDRRNEILKSFMAIFATEDAGSVRYNIRIKIPKMYQRIRAGDKHVIVARSSEVGSLSVGFRYKYFN